MKQQVKLYINDFILLLVLYSLPKVEDGEEGGDGGDSPGYDDYDSDDSIIDTFSVKDGGPIPLLQVRFYFVLQKQ